MNLFDSSIMEYVNSFSRVSGIFDTTIYFVAGNHLIKGGFLLLLFWWAWFKPTKSPEPVRKRLISTLIACFIAMTAARILALTLPFRLRPIHDDSISFLLPYSMPRGMLEGWSSFPSDTAVLFFCLSTGIFFVSRKVGLLALAHTTLLICLPRIYLGMHYPTDIIAGGAVGVGIAWLCNSSIFHNKISRHILVWETSKPQFFYPLLFLISYQIADMFNNSRDFFSFLHWLTFPH